MSNVFYLQGVVPHLRAGLWPFLLGVFSPYSTAAERRVELARLKSLYTKLVLVCQELDVQIEAARRAQEVAAARAKARDTGPHNLARSPDLMRPSPELPPMPGNLTAFSDAHRIIVLDSVRTDMRIQPSDVTAAAAAAGGTGSGTSGNGSTAESAIPTVTVLPVSVGDGLPELMLVDPPQPGPVEAVANGELPVWRSALAVSTIDGATHVSPTSRRLMMRLVNVLSAYAVHDPENGYCQGMSDLAAAFVQLIPDDALAFACFEHMMRDARRNFRHDETGIKAQLHKVSRILADTDPVLHRKLKALGAADCTFAYRMVLVMLRRELPLGEALILWEVKWALEAAEAAEAEAAALGEAGQRGTLSEGPASHMVSPGTSPSTSGSAGIAATVASMDAAAKVAVAEGEGAATGTSGRLHGRSTPVKGLHGGGLRSASIRAAHQQRVSSSSSSPDFVLQFVAAAIRAERTKILTECLEGDDVLRLFNAVKIDFWTALAQARKQHKAYAQGIAVLRRL